MGGNSPDQRHERLVAQVRGLDQHQHLCAIYENKEQQFAAVIPLFLDAIARGERCLYLANEDNVEETFRRLEAAGVDIDAAVKNGSLTVTPNSAYLTHGVFDPDAMIAFLSDSTRKAEEAGFAGLCFAGDLSWVMGRPPGFTHLAEYEAKLDDFYSNHKALGICQYDRQRFPAETLLEVIKTHPVILYGDFVSENPYYIPPKQYLGRDRPEIELLRVLDSLRDYEVAAKERKEAQGTLDRLSARLLNAQDEERRRIARQLHETVVQDLTALKMNLARITRSDSISDATLGSVLSESMALTDESLQELRTLSHLLHPPLLEESGLLFALRWYVAGFGERSGITVTLDAPVELERLPQETEIAIFRIVQEALTNVHRHSDSRSAKVQLIRDKNSIYIEVKDAGKGMDIHVAGKVMGVGIEGMRERVQQLGGTLEIRSSGKGTLLKVELPIKESESWPKFAS
jgi:signal transduction histidine kinase